MSQSGLGGPPPPTDVQCTLYSKSVKWPQGGGLGLPKVFFSNWSSPNLDLIIGFGGSCVFTLVLNKESWRTHSTVSSKDLSALVTNLYLPWDIKSYLDLNLTELSSTYQVKLGLATPLMNSLQGHIFGTLSCIPKIPYQIRPQMSSLHHIFSPKF